MPYTVNFTDRNTKVPITVYDNTSNTDTSLSFPGRNVTGYGQIIAENFLHLLENFASNNQPVNPVEGQLWYDTNNEQLKIWDSTNWKAASNIQTSVSEPDVASSRKGDLWVDTSNQQLSIYSGSRWILVGPFYSGGTKTGPLVEDIISQDTTTKTVLTFYVDDKPVAIISSVAFSPKTTITGFELGIKPGLNITSAVLDTGYVTKMLGVATSAENLRIGTSDIAATKFLRTDQINTVDFQFNINNPNGLVVNSEFRLQNTETGAKIYNALAGSTIDIQTSKLSLPNTVIRIKNESVGVNQLDPQESLDVIGNQKLSGTLFITNTASSVNLASGSIQTAGGIAVTKSAVIGGNLEVQNTATMKSILPKDSNAYDIGSDSQQGGKRFNNVYARTIIADTFRGSFDGNITGTSGTADSLKQATTFRLLGDVVSDSVSFDGATGGYTKNFNTTLSVNLFTNRQTITSSDNETEVLVYVPRASTTDKIRRMNRDDFVGSLGIPVGTILPYAGTIAPPGFFLCDGSEVLKNRYRDLYDIILERFVPLNYTWIGDPELYFKLPDLRGRFPLGKEDMDQGNLVGAIDAGGGTPTPRRVPGDQSTTLGGFAGSASSNLAISNLPQHEHDLRGTRLDGSKGEQYFGYRADTATPSDGAQLIPGPAAYVSNQLQGLPTSGGIKDRSTSQLGLPFSLMNPFLTVNYIIRYGVDKFSTLT